MKREKDEKIMGPMFPRLHVNDTDKGGPRAPPRNKMALYEQLSIPSNRFSHAAANSVHPSSQGAVNERDMFFSYHLPTRPQFEKQCTQYPDLDTPSTQIEQRENSEDDDFTVPIFFHSVPNQECREYTNFNHRLQFQNSKNLGTPEDCVEQEAESQKEENLRKKTEFATDRITPVSTSSTIEKSEGLKQQSDSNDSVEPELCDEYKPDSERYNTSVLDENVAALEKRNYPTSVEAFLSEDQEILHDISNKTEFQDRPCRSQNTRNLERVGSLSENPVVGSISGLDITPDDVVGIIGQKHFWKARKEIVNQQRIFAVQVFELHRIIEVQRLIAASPHLLLKDSAYFNKPIKASPGKRKLLDDPVKEIPHVHKQKGEPDKPIHKKKSYTGDATEKKASFSSVQTGSPPSNLRPVIGNSHAPSVSSDYNPGPWGFNPPLGNQWLIPVMSPSEGLVYKPYPVPAFEGPVRGGCGPPDPLMGNFPTPAYGIPAPQFSPFHRAGLHGYFPPYGMPITNFAAFSGSSDNQINGAPFSNQILARVPNLSTMLGHKNRASPDVLDNLNASEDIEAQASIASSSVERLQDYEESKSMEERNVLPLFPTSPPVDGPESGSQAREPERPTQVIKVVPHNARSASESAARIFQSIQEGRKLYDLP